MQTVQYNTCNWFKPEGRVLCLKKNQNAPRPSEQSPVRWEKISNVSFFAKNIDSATMAMVPLCMMVHSQVAVLLPVGEARAMCFENRRLGKYTHAVQIVANLQCPIKYSRQIGFGLRICTLRESTRSNNIPYPIPMPIKDGLDSSCCHKSNM